MYPPTASTTEESVSVSAEASTKPTRTEPSTGTGPTTDHATGIAATNTKPTPLWMESRPAIVFQNSPSEGPGTTWFVPSRKSLIHGPTQGADGHLWMDGSNVTCYEKKGVEIRQVSIRVAQVPQLLYQYHTEADLSVGRTRRLPWRSSLSPS